MSDAELDAAISAWTAAGATSAAHRLLFIGEKTARNYDEDWESTEDTDAAWNSAAAEISLASGISHGRASGDMEIGIALAARLPKITALLLAGQISEYLARRITERTANIQDPDLLALVQDAIAERAVTWGALSKKKLAAAIDVWVDRYDPGALKHTRVRVRDRGVEIRESTEGIAEILLRLKGADAALYYRRLTLMAQAVCKDDPRTLDQRRADAHGALGAGFFHLACECGTPGCPAAVDDGRGSHVVVYLYAEHGALAARPDPLMDGDGLIPDQDAPPPANDVEPAGHVEIPRPSTVRRPPPGIIPDFGHIPAEEIAARIAAGAKFKHLRPPGIEPEDRYRPSVGLDEWVRARDLTCRFPHCDRPAQFCDFDHTVPWPTGSTHASGAKMLCRHHHIGKTFWSGWSDVQHPDGTIIWTTPAGQTYTTKPGSSLFFPTVDTTSAPIVTGTPTPNSPDKIQNMPKRRKRNRAKDRAHRIAAERALNDAYVAERNKPPPF
jgi:hypothetical protein